MCWYTVKKSFETYPDQVTDFVVKVISQKDVRFFMFDDFYFKGL